MLRTRICPGCQREFNPALPADLRCRVCKAERAGDLDLAFAELAWRSGYALAAARAEESAMREREKLGSLLDSLPLRDLVALCHPDRHPPERTELATRITVYLNELRDAKGEAA